MGLALSDIKNLIEKPESFGFKLEVKKRKPREKINNVKENGIRIENIWINCDKNAAECIVLDENENLFIIDFNKKVVTKYGK